MILSSADGAIRAGCDALDAGKPILVDATMVGAGIMQTTFCGLTMR